MNNRNALFAQSVNKIAEAWIQPEVEACRQELIATGKLDNEKIEELLLKAKIEMQAKYLPIIKKQLEDKFNSLHAERMRSKK